MIVRRKDRARNDEAKTERRQAILDAAWAMFQSMPYPAITIAGVAGQTALAKGTIYLYFKTKEEMFLQVTMAQLDQWFDTVDAALGADHLDAAAIAALLTISLDDRLGLVRLLAILHSVIEQNIDAMAALGFKQMLLRRMTHTGALLEASLGFLPAGEGVLLLLRIHALIVGLQSLAEPDPVVDEVLSEPGMDVLAIDFRREFAETLKALLRGMEMTNDG